MSTMSQLIATRTNKDACISVETGVARMPDNLANQGAIIVNADDWGCDRATTDRTLDCFRVGSISSVSAMVFMADSERAADTACLHGIDAGLHLNFTAPYSAQNCSRQLMEHQQKVARTLTAHRYASALYHPGLAASFEYLVTAQLEEYKRLYGAAAVRIDGHHHMHLCANVLRQALLPKGCIVRRNLTFSRGEKSYQNRLYRRMQDRRLARRHQVADYFFDLNPVEPLARLRRISELGSHHNVEIETHPIRDEEYTFLMNDEMQRGAGAMRIANGYVLRSRVPDCTKEILL